MFLSSADFLKSFLILSGITSDCQTVWIQFGPTFWRPFLIWVKTVCKGYQQTILEGKALKDKFSHLQKIILGNRYNDLVYMSAFLYSSFTRLDIEIEENLFPTVLLWVIRSNTGSCLMNGEY